jgi:hypothetical protein
MMVLTKSQLMTKLEQEVKGLTSYLDSDDYSNASDDASRETGFSFPVSDGFQTYWIKTRAKRHLFFYLLSESAHKFKYEQINLQHRFEHYRDIIKYMDEQYALALEEYALEFAGATGINALGTKIDAGFAYEPQTGRDQTYDDDNVTILSPTEND